MSLPAITVPDPLVYAVLQQILNRLDTLENVALQIQHDQGVIMSEQSHIDTETAEIVTDNAAILAAVQSLKAANPTVDFSKLDAAIAGEDAAAAAVQGLEPTAPAPAPSPAATPVSVTDTNNAVQGQPLDIPPATPPAA